MSDCMSISGSHSKRKTVESLGNVSIAFQNRNKKIILKKSATGGETYGYYSM